MGRQDVTTELEDKMGVKIQDVKEQIQEDLITYCEGKLPLDYRESQDMIDDLCQIIVDNFAKIEYK